MASLKTKRAKPLDSGKLIINEINQVSVNRTPKNVGDWRNAHIAAESIQTPNRTRLYDLYEDVSLDGYLTGVWQKRQADATNKDITFVDKDGKPVEGVNKLMESEEWDTMLDHIMNSKLWGISGIEFKMGPKFTWEEIPRKHIMPEKQIIKIGQNDLNGTDYRNDPYIWVVGRKKDLGLLLKCSFYALIKKGNFADWAQYSEIFGQPIRVIRYEAWDDKTRIQLKQVLDESGSSLALMIPKQADFEIMDGKTSNGDGQLQERLKNACNNEMGIVILGNVETTGNDNGGSNSKAQEQGKEQAKITKKDIKFLVSQLNSDKLLAVLADYGYPVEGGKFIIQKEFDPYKAKAKMEIINMMKDGGTPVDDDYIYEEIGVPKPKKYDQLKKELAEKKQAFNPENPAQQPAPAPDPKEKAKTKPTQAYRERVNLWHSLRAKLADFFDLPR